MKLATKNRIQEIADEMSSAIQSVHIKKKWKKCLFKIAKKIGKKELKNNKKALKATAKNRVNVSDNHLPAASPHPQKNIKPQGIKK
jgi:hypothetical protein